MTAGHRITRSLACLAILVAGACTTAMNWRFSYQLGTTDWDSYTWAIFSVALDVTKWLMLPVAALAWRHHRARSLAAFSIWLIATIYSFTAAVGFAALNRDTTTAERLQQAELHKTLETMKRSPRWQSSAACADATSKQSKEFCANYRAVIVRVKSLPQDADPQSALLSRLTGIPPDTVRLLLAVFLATACEVISALGFFAILSGAPTTPRPSEKMWRPPPTRDAVTPPSLATARHDASGRDVPWRSAKWKSPR